MNRVFIGIGSNEGDRLSNISAAVHALSNLSDIRVVQMATIFETEPVGGPPQGPYLNTVVELKTTREPIELFGVLKNIERQLGRQESSLHWAPRTIDLDILLYDDRVIQEQDLVIPHPRMHERQFVLAPLAQLAPGFIHPVLHQSIAALLEQVLAKAAA